MSEIDRNSEVDVNTNIASPEETIDVSSVKPIEEILAKELTEEEKRLKFIEAIKQSHLNYKPKKHFGAAYKAERKRKNKAQRKSRKNSR